MDFSAQVLSLNSKNHYDFGDLRDIMTLLRAEGGCPWDREQTHESIRKNLIEETYEVAEAIDRKDPAMLREELGDLLLQVVFHAQMSAEEGSFTMDDVCDEICKKLIVRHPHIFGDVTAENSAEVLRNWDAIKQQTKKQSTASATLDAVPRTLPALMRACKTGQRAARAGFDFPDTLSAFEKIPEETDELRREIVSGNADAAQEELGDLLFSVVNTARKLKIDPEEALTRATDKFSRRFAAVEKDVLAAGKTISSLPMDELDAFWVKNK